MGLLKNTFTFDGDGTSKDRLLTALIILLFAYLLSLAAAFLEWGRFLAVAWAFCIVGMSSLEVARMFARDEATSRYLPLRGVWLFLLYIAPAGAAMISAVEWVAHGVLDFTLPYLVTAISAVVLTITHVILGREDLDGAARIGSRLAPAFMLVSVCGTQLIPLAAHQRGIQMLWWIIGTVAINDAAAYFVGRSLGRSKMAPAISPNKTIEGSLAGVLVGAAAGIPLWYALVGIPLSVNACGLLVVLSIVGGQAADLSKSYIKRLCGVKDTGAFFPGHGGVLDRFDGAIGAAPFLLLWLYVCGVLAART